MPASDQPLGLRRAISLKMTITARQLHRRFDQSVAKIGVTRSQWSLIAVIARRPGATQREIAEVLEMSEAAAGRLVDKLCAEGLLLRKPKEDDRRAHCVHLTEAGGAILAQISAIATEHENHVFADFSDEDLARFDHYLELLARQSAPGG